MYWPFLNMYSGNFGFGPGGFYYQGDLYESEEGIREMHHLIYIYIYIQEREREGERYVNTNIDRYMDREKQRGRLLSV